jgi:flagellar assembly factor FliW
MPSLETKYFGTLPFGEDAVFHFPQGIPGFEEEQRFVLIEAGERAPLVFLQSMARANLCFAALPIQVVERQYQMAIAPEDLEELELDTGHQPALGVDVTVLALISVQSPSGVTANLMAPVVLNLKTRRGLQAIRRDARYSHEHPLAGPPPAAEDAGQSAGKACPGETC